MFLILLIIILEGYFLYNRTIFDFVDKLSPVSNMAYSCLKSLMASKDQDPMKSRSGVIYRFQCDRVECDDEYIGESLRTFGEMFKEHLKDPSPIFDHFNTSGHQVSIENFSVVGREEQNLMRAIKEALYIRVNNPSLNRNIGKYHLPHIWDEVLFNISELKLK